MFSSKIIAICNYTLVICLLQVGIHTSALAQEANILGSSVNGTGQIELDVSSSADQYFVLNVKHNEDEPFTITSSMTLGENGITTITESLMAYPENQYQVLFYDRNTPFDTDGDGIDDITEYNNLPLQSPLNAAPSVDRADGLVAIDSFTTFKEMSVVFDNVQWSEFLNEKVFVKFLIVDFLTDQPKVYFINSNRYGLHSEFANACLLYTSPSPRDRG